MGYTGLTVNSRVLRLHRQHQTGFLATHPWGWCRCRNPVLQPGLPRWTQLFLAHPEPSQGHRQLMGSWLISRVMTVSLIADHRQPPPASLHNILKNKLAIFCRTSTSQRLVGATVFRFVRPVCTRRVRSLKPLPFPHCEKDQTQTGTGHLGMVLPSAVLTGDNRFSRWRSV